MGAAVHDSFRAVSVSASPLPALWSTSRKCFCSTSRSARSI
jgi:hypothetical protein